MVSTVAALDVKPQSGGGLAGTCEACFATVLLLRNTADLGMAEDLRARIKAQLDATAAGLRRTNLAESDVQDMLFAIVALIDETISLSSWPHRSGWLALPLQQELFKRFDAGEEFFTKLTSLREQFPKRRQVLEVYYHSLALGFQGKYQFLDQAELMALTDHVRSQLLGSAPAEQPLSPRGARENRMDVLPPEGVPLWVIWAAAGLLAFVVYVLFRWRSSANADALRAAIDNSVIMLFWMFPGRRAGGG